MKTVARMMGILCALLIFCTLEAQIFVDSEIAGQLSRGLVIGDVL